MQRPRLPGKYRVYFVAASVLAAILALVLVFLGFRILNPPPATVRNVAAGARTQAVDPPHPMPELAFARDGGQPVSLADFQGRTVLLNLWATWCAPCVEEMPALDRLQAQMGGPDFEVVALSLDLKGAEVVEPFRESQKLTHLAPYYDTSGAALQVLGPPGLPTTYLIDPQGREVRRWIGPVDWDAAEVRALLAP